MVQGPQIDDKKIWTKTMKSNHTLTLLMMCCCWWGWERSNKHFQPHSIITSFIKIESLWVLSAGSVPSPAHKGTSWSWQCASSWRALRFQTYFWPCSRISSIGKRSSASLPWRDIPSPDRHRRRGVPRAGLLKRVWLFRPSRSFRPPPRFSWCSRCGSSFTSSSSRYRIRIRKLSNLWLGIRTHWPE